jgi:hypothetical protein
MTHPIEYTWPRTSIFWKTADSLAAAVMSDRNVRSPIERSRGVPKSTIVCDVPCPPDAAFSFVTNPAHLREWRMLETVQVAPAGDLEVGSRLHVRVPGPLRRLSFSHEVAVLDRTKRIYADRALGGPFLVEHGWSVAPLGTGSRVQWSLRFRFRGPARLFSHLLVPAIGRSHRAESERLKQALSGEPARV